MSICTCKIERTETTVSEVVGIVTKTQTKIEVKHMVNPECAEHGGGKMLEGLPKIEMPDFSKIFDGFKLSWSGAEDK